MAIGPCQPIRPGEGNAFVWRERKYYAYRDRGICAGTSDLYKRTQLARAQGPGNTKYEIRNAKQARIPNDRNAPNEPNWPGHRAREIRSTNVEIRDKSEIRRAKISNEPNFGVLRPGMRVPLGNEVNFRLEVPFLWSTACGLQPQHAVRQTKPICRRGLPRGPIP